MADKKCPECPKCLPGWLVQFGDLMSLLLTFFILLLSMAVMDKKKVEEYFEVMKKAMGFLDQSTSSETQSEKHEESKGGADDGQESVSDAENAAEEVEEVMEQMNESAQDESEMVEITKGQNEFTLDIPSTLMFSEGEYELSNKGAKRFISKIARVIRTMPQAFNIEITGHTDNSNYQSNTIPRDQWDISALRSISVVKELIKNRIDPAQLKVAALASFHPKSDNAAENRRVELRFYSSDNAEDVLEEENFFDRLEE